MKRLYLNFYNKSIIKLAQNLFVIQLKHSNNGDGKIVIMAYNSILVYAIFFKTQKG